MKRPVLIPSMLAVLVGICCTSCRREAGAPGTNSNNTTARATKAPAEHAEESSGATKKRRPASETHPEDEAGWVTLDASVLAGAPTIYSLDTIDFSTRKRVLETLGLTLEKLEEIKTTNSDLIGRARRQQLEMLGPVEFALDKTVTVPALEDAQIESLREAFEESLSEDIPEKTQEFLEQLFIASLRKDYGATLRITLRDTGTTDTVSMRHLPSDMLGLHFVVEGSPEGTYQLSPGQSDGGRFSYLQVPPGVKGSVRFK